MSCSLDRLDTIRPYLSYDTSMNGCQADDGMAVISATGALTAVKLEADDNRSNSENAKKKNDYGVGGRNRNGSVPRLSLSKPSWVVRTESNVRKEIRKTPNSPCVVCKGTGRVDCFHCSGKGRTNCVDLAMLPKGEWPKWCITCGGSGLSYCSRCLGTGEYRNIMGFHFMKRDYHDNQDPRHLPKPGPHTAADRLLNGDQSTS